MFCGCWLVVSRGWVVKVPVPEAAAPKVHFGLEVHPQGIFLLVCSHPLVSLSHPLPLPPSFPSLFKISSPPLRCLLSLPSSCPSLSPCSVPVCWPSLLLLHLLPRNTHSTLCILEFLGMILTACSYM